MAEGILFNLAANILTKLGSLPVEEIKLLTGVPTEITKLESTVSTIKAVLLDAQIKQFTSHEVKNWLMKLEDVMYDFDDLLDSVSTEKLWREAMTREKKAKKAHIFFSSSNQLLFRHKTGQKIISIREKLEAIAKDRAQFHFNEHLIEDSARQRERTLTESFVREEDVIGRDDDKEVILNFLLNPHVEENVAVKCICGLGGLGKTTLAQSVYNDERVKRYFELQEWVCVSNDFNVTSIAKAILGSESNGHEVKTKLAEQLNEKRYLIVLDDVWNDDRAKWLDLKTLLDYGARGSKVIVTTREEKMARVCGDTYCIQSLSPDQSWAMFCKFAFTGGKEPTEKNLIKTAKEIVKKCRGVPLAIRVLGSMLYGIRSEQWSTFLNSELSSIDQVRDSIMPILQVSYDKLPSHLKNCFAYCALFPQDYLYEKKEVVDFWVALGFIPPSSRSLEDTGYIYCEELIERSFFQRVESEDAFFYNIERFKMHDLMHDLASLVSGMMHHEEHHRNVRHYRGDTWHKSFDSTTLRSFVYQEYRKRLLIDLRSVCEASSLRVLDLSDACVLEVPNCIAKLKHLRYLNLSSTRIRKLPKSICRLQKLRTLILYDCFYLRALPRGLTKLVNLEHLSVRGCIYDLPSGSGKVTCLQKLPKLFPSQKQGTFNLGDLNKLNKLKDLDINSRMLNTQSHLEAKDANLEGNENMRRLVLRSLTNDEMLEAFRPHENLKEFDVDEFSGVISIPNWLTTLTNLASIHLNDSDTCKYLPPLHQLPALKTLGLYNLPALKYIADDKELPSLSSSFFPSLENLHLVNLSFKAWWKTQAIEDGNGHKAASTSMPQHNNNEQQHLLYQFPHLSRLVIQYCPDLTSIPASQVQITHLSVYDCDETLEHSLREQERLKSLKQTK